MASQFTQEVVIALHSESLILAPVKIEAESISWLRELPPHASYTGL
jgi:hypothetical protein